MNQKSIVFIAIGVLLVAFGGAAFMYDTQKSDEKNALVSANSSALIKFHSPRSGNPAAKVTLVEFLDPACETCSRFHPFVKEILKTYKGKVNLVVRYAPFHPGSEETVKMLEAARKQGMPVFWDVLELMFDTQEGWASHHNPQPEKLWEYLTYYKFDVARMKKDMTDPSFDRIIKTDLADAKALGVNKTPSYFVNGKPLTNFGSKQLAQLVASEVAANYE
ncbi:MAG: thioredoxin domain-containing protein [Ghiorsea sp.]